VILKAVFPWFLNLFTVSSIPFLRIEKSHNTTFRHSTGGKDVKKLTWVSLILVAVLVGWGTASSGATTGLAAYYPFNANANDESGNGNNATVSGATLTTDRNGKANSAYSFDGKDDGIRATAGPGFSVTSLTLSAWIKISGAGDHSPRIVAVGPSGSAFQYYSLILENTSSSRRLWFYTSKSVSNAYSSFYLTNDNTWHFVAVTYSAGSVSFYLDGSLSNTETVSGSLETFSSGVMQIGSSDNGLDRFDGEGKSISQAFVERPSVVFQEG
jgi:hypothetical protein